MSVVVSTYSEERSAYVEDCVASLKKQSLQPQEIMLVLDPRPSLLKHYRLKFHDDDVIIITSEGFGLSNARNAGIRNASADVVAFIDDDAVADPHWIRNLIALYDDPRVVGVGGRIIPVWEGGCPPWFPSELNWIVGCSYKGLPEQRKSVRNPIGCNMSFRRSIFNAVGYFRTDLGRFGATLLGSEEPELSLRILNRFPEFKIIYEPRAVVYHKVSKKRRKITYLFKRSFYEGVSKALVVPQKRSGNRELSTENQYLSYLFSTAIPSRIKHSYRLENLSQLMVLIFSTSAVLLGFSIGRLAGNGSTSLQKNNT